MARRQRDDESVVSGHLWLERIDAWSLSGQTQRLFCLRQGISENLFSRWKANLAQRERQRAASPSNAVELVESRREDLAWAEVAWPSAEPVETPDSSCGFEIVLPRGWSVRLGSEFEAEPLRRLLGVLEGFAC